MPRSALIGVSPWVRRVQSEIDRVSPFDASVLITGPSGTGKELIARSIHERSQRASQPFIAVNCAAITGTLFESHMFGHLKGAFTGSNYDALGCFRAAEGGTIFLDEFGELEPSMQAKLLRVLQERVVVPVGGHEEHPIDVRVLAATNRDLVIEAATGDFREDLYYRVAVVTIRTESLSQRPIDIDRLCDYLLSRLAVQHGIPYKPLTDAALEKLRGHAWPGNVRELQNVLERACIMSSGDLIQPEDILFDAPATEVTAAMATDHEAVQERRFDLEKIVSTESREAWPTLEQCERELLSATLAHTDGNQTAAAKLLDLDRSVLRRRIKRLGIEISS